MFVIIFEESLDWNPIVVKSLVDVHQAVLEETEATVLGAMPSENYFDLHYGGFYKLEIDTRDRECVDGYVQRAEDWT